MDEAVATRRGMSGLSLVVVVMSLSLGCSSPSAPTTSSTPTPGPPLPGPQPTPSMADVRIEGRVVDAETETSIGGANVSTDGVCYPGRCGNVDKPTTAVTGANGTFVLTANIPQDWRELLLNVTGAGYETTKIYVSPPVVMAAELRLLRTLIIRPGESIALRVFTGSYVCGFESNLCRRVLVESPTGESVNVEVVPASSEREAGLFTNQPFTVTSFPRHVTVPGGEVWIYPAGAERPEKRSGSLAVFDQPMTLIAHTR